MAQQNVSFIRPQEVVDGDKTEVRYRGYNGEQKIATSAQLDEVKANLEKVLDSLKSADFANGIPTLDWASTKYAVTLTLTKCSADNTDARTSGKYETTLTPDSGYEFGDSAVAVTMGGTTITTTAWDASTGKVTIAEVTGAIAITATATAVNNG